MRLRPFSWKMRTKSIQDTSSISVCKHSSNIASCLGARTIAPLGIGDAQGGVETALFAWLLDAAKGLAEAGYGQRACCALVEKLQRGAPCEEGFVQLWDAVNLPGPSLSLFGSESHPRPQQGYGASI